MTYTPPTPPPKRPSLHLNWRDWLPYLEATDATEEEKRALIETVWAIMFAFVDLGWDIDAQELIGGQSLDLTDMLRAAMVHSKDTNMQENV